MIAESRGEGRSGDAKPKSDMSEASLCPAGGATANTIVGGDCRDDSGNFEIASGISSSTPAENPALKATLVQPSDAGVNETQLPLVQDVFRFVTDGNGEPKVIGAGGQASVILAEHITGGFPVALKRSASPNDPRSDREKELTARLQAEGFVSLIGYYRDADGHTYIAMRYIEGATLKQLFEGFFRAAESLGPAADKASLQQFESCLRKLIDVMSSVHIMHEAGLIHRDLKPGNILVCQRSGKPVLLDLGLATAWNDGSVEQLIESDAQPQIQANITGAGQVLGTLSYMPPESAGQYQAIGQYTPQTDIYSLGAVLFHLATGRCQVPEFPENMNQFEYQSQLENRLERIRRGSVESLDLYPFIPRPRELQAIILKAMQTDPAERYRSVKDMSADLEAWWRGAPVPVYRDGLSSTSQWLYDLSHWLRDRPKLLGGGVVAGAIAAVIAPLSALWYAERQKFEAQAAIVAAEMESDLEQLKENFGSELSNLTERRSIEQISVEILDRKAPQISQLLKQTLGKLGQKMRTDGAEVIRHPQVDRENMKLGAFFSEVEGLSRQLDRRLAARAEVLAELELFRKDFGPVRDLVGNELGHIFSERSNDRLYAILGMHLPTFTEAHQRSRAGELKLSNCDQDVSKLLVELSSRIEAGSMTREEVRELRWALGECLLRVVAGMKITEMGRCSEDVRQYLPVLKGYLTNCRQLAGEDIGPFRWNRLSSRVALASGDEQQPEGIHEYIQNQALNGEYSAVGTNRDELGALAYLLIDLGNCSRAAEIFEIIARLPDDSEYTPSHFIASLGRAAVQRRLALESSTIDGAVQAINASNTELMRALECIRTYEGDDWGGVSASIQACLGDNYLSLDRISLVAKEDPAGFGQSFRHTSQAWFDEASKVSQTVQVCRLRAEAEFFWRRYDEALLWKRKLLKFDETFKGEVMAFEALCFAQTGDVPMVIEKVRTLLSEIPPRSPPMQKQFRRGALALARLASRNRSADILMTDEQRSDVHELAQRCLDAILEGQRDYLPFPYQELALKEEDFTALSPELLSDYDRRLRELSE